MTGWTQDQLAQRAQVSTNTLSQLERNPAPLSMVSIVKILRALGISFEEIVSPPFPIDTAKGEMSLQRFLHFLPRQI